MVRIIFLLLVAAVLSLPSFGQAQSSKEFRAARINDSAANRRTSIDSLRAAYRQISRIKKRLRNVRRLDAHTDNKGRAIRFNIVKVDVPNWCFGEPNLGYERKIGHHSTVMLHGAYFAKEYQREQDSTGTESTFRVYTNHAFYPGQLTFRGYSTQSRAIKLMPELRTYLGRNAPRGFYIGAYYYFQHVDWRIRVHSMDSAGQAFVSSGSSRLTVHGPGVVWGVQSIVLRRVSLGFEMGSAYMIGNKSVMVPLAPSPQGSQSYRESPQLAGPKIALRFNAQLGYCFGR